MARRASATVPVELAGGCPVGFRFHGRRYRVRAVLARWVEARPWWRDRGSRGGQVVTWRVEAVCGTTAGTYDLRELADRWRLVRVDD